jgi:uncharacterized protein
MSEFINNSKLRQEKLKEIIKSLHEGVSLSDAKTEFEKHFSTVTTSEISQMEQALIKDGMTIGEIQRLCDVHASLFDGSIEDIHESNDLSSISGHPVAVFKDENKHILNLIETEIEPYLKSFGKSNELMLRVGLDRLYEIHKHYARKENLFFPYLEKKGIDGPPQVMWAKDDEIRNKIKEALNLLSSIDHDQVLTYQKINEAINDVKDMVSKENNILIPLLSETLGFFDWVIIDSASDEIGYFIDAPKQKWTDKKAPLENEEKDVKHVIDGLVQFDTGSLSPEILNIILNTLQVDLTFVDHDGYVKYFTQGAERIFDRPKTILGRHVSMCHPPQSVHVVEGIIESFKSGKKDHEDFWISFGPMFVYIRYFAIRNKEGKYLGTLEITQNIKPIRELEGQKRLVSKD